MPDETGTTDHEGRVIDFGRTATDYERHRPGFPESFFDLLTTRGWITRTFATSGILPR